MVKVASEGDVASIEAVNRAHPFYRSHVVWEDEDAVVEDEGRTCVVSLPCGARNLTLETPRSMRSCDFHAQMCCICGCCDCYCYCWLLLLLLVAAADVL